MTSSPPPGGAFDQPTRSAVDVSIATAGHVDHGKSTLVQALTGTDPDRLPEERRREMTIELGFASIPRPGGGTIALIDVPGHDRLVETMIGGAGGIDAALLVVAADDGPMPQTVEHLRILRLLGIDRVIVAMTRIDLVEDDWLALATETTRNVLLTQDYAESAIVPVSARTGVGLASLRAHLAAIEPADRRSEPDEAAWLPIDRAFVVGGHGTVVAGTLIRGRLARDDGVVLAATGLHARVRQIQSHGIAVTSAVAGQRVAVNLVGVSLDQVRRGNVLSNRPIARTTNVDVQILSVDCTAGQLKSGDRIRVLVGTDRLDATIHLLSPSELFGAAVALARLRFGRPVAIAIGDRVIIRRPSPASTLAGGTVLARYADRPDRVDPHRLAELIALAGGDNRPTLMRRLEAGPVTVERATIDLLPGAMGILHEAVMDGSVRRVGPDNDFRHHLGSTTTVMAEAAWRRFVDRLCDELASFHADSPEAEGVPHGRLRAWFLDPIGQLDQLLASAVQQGYVVRSASWVSLRGYRPRIPGTAREEARRLIGQLAALPLGHSMAPTSQREGTLGYLERIGSIVRLPGGRVIDAARFDAFGIWAIEAIRELDGLELKAVRDRLGIGRDHAQLLLERLEALGLTRRDGDRHRPGPAARSWLDASAARRQHRTGREVIERWDDPTRSSAHPVQSWPRMTLFLTSDDPAGWVTTGASLVGAVRTGRSVRQMVICSRPAGQPDESDGMARRITGQSPIMVDADGISTEALVARIQGIVRDLDLERDDLRVFAPLGLSGDPITGPLGSASIELARSGRDVLFYEDRVPNDFSNSPGSSLPARIGSLTDQDLTVRPVTVAIRPEHQMPVVDAIMENAQTMRTLIGRDGFDHDRTTLANLVAGFHRGLRDDLAVERLWSIGKVQGTT